MLSHGLANLQTFNPNLCCFWLSITDILVKITQYWNFCDKFFLPTFCLVLFPYWLLKSRYFLLFFVFFNIALFTILFSYRLSIKSLSNLYASIPQNVQIHSNNSSANCQRIVWVCLNILWDWRLKC